MLFLLVFLSLSLYRFVFYLLSLCLGFDLVSIWLRFGFDLVSIGFDLVWVVRLMLFVSRGRLILKYVSIISVGRRLPQPSPSLLCTRNRLCLVFDNSVVFKHRSPYAAHA